MANDQFQSLNRVSFSIQVQQKKRKENHVQLYTKAALQMEKNLV